MDDQKVAPHPTPSHPSNMPFCFPFPETTWCPEDHRKCNSPKVFDVGPLLLLWLQWSHVKATVVSKTKEKKKREKKGFH